MKHGIGIHDIKVHYHIHCGRNFFFKKKKFICGTAGNDFEVERGGTFLNNFLFYFVFASNKLYKY